MKAIPIAKEVATQAKKIGDNTSSTYDLLRRHMTNIYKKDLDNHCNALLKIAGVITCSFSIMIGSTPFLLCATAITGMVTTIYFCSNDVDKFKMECAVKANWELVTERLYCCRRTKAAPRSAIHNPAEDSFANREIRKAEQKYPIRINSLDDDGGYVHSHQR
jgi:hypothetical protein